MNARHSLSVALVALCAGACDTATETTDPAGADERPGGAASSVNGARIRAADSEPGSWLSHGRTYDEQRFSPLDEIDESNVSRLGLAWSYDTGETRGHESSPIVADGRMYLTTPWSKVIALDAASGEELWTYDPKVPGEVGRWACCDVVNRGVALWNGKIYVGVLDGRLEALDAATGDLVWSVRTTDPDKPYTITAAPRVVKGKVIIGNGGAEYGVRGYVSAYDAESGDLAWRFYTVPGNPSEPFEHAELEAAAATWSGEWWQVGGGGTVWDSIAYDPELDLVYVGVGNGSPWTREHRSPGGGDNLYLSSILALRSETGELAWHYQTTPGDNWDYTATQHMILADLEIGGEERQVIMQAPKNGFFYVLDRATGELLSAEAYVTTTWASHVDPESGRPVETGGGDYSEEAKVVLPGPSGGHNWHPMSYSPETGLVYIPAREMAMVYTQASKLDYDPRAWNLGIDWASWADLGAKLPQPTPRGYIKAWDPVAQRKVWEIEQPAAFNGGMLTTAGDLLFQGTADGRFAAYRASDGEPLWEVETGVGIVAPPIAFVADGVENIAVLAGWGGNVVSGMDAGVSAATTHQNPGRLLVFRLDGSAEMPAVGEKVLEVPPPPERTASDEVVADGFVLFHQHCAVCHGPGAISSGVIADLRYAGTSIYRQETFDEIVLGGHQSRRGMAGFDDLLDEEQADSIRAWLIEQARALGE